MHAQAAPSSSPANHGTLLIRTLPSAGLTLRIDGQKRAYRAPYQTVLAAGKHLVEIRAMGHKPVSVIVDLQSGQTFELPVALQPYPSPYKTSTEVSEPSTAAEPPNNVSSKTPPKKPPQKTAENTLQFNILAVPHTQVMLDGHAVTGTRISLTQTSGVLTAGILNLRYHISSSGLVSLSPWSSQNKGSYTQDGLAVGSSQPMLLNAHVSRIAFTSSAGSSQALVLRKIE
jgi:hypothetical protein